MHRASARSARRSSMPSEADQKTPGMPTRLGLRPTRRPCPRPSQRIGGKRDERVLLLRRRTCSKSGTAGLGQNQQSRTIRSRPLLSPACATGDRSPTDCWFPCAAGVRQTACCSSIATRARLRLRASRVGYGRRVHRRPPDAPEGDTRGPQGVRWCRGFSWRRGTPTKVAMGDDTPECQCSAQTPPDLAQDRGCRASTGGAVVAVHGPRNAHNRQVAPIQLTRREPR